MLRIENLTYRIGKRVLFDRASVSINGGHRVGFAGRNGTGKTTLLSLITGQLEPDEGVIEMPPRWRIGVTRQEAPSGRQTLTEAVLAADRELHRLQQESETATDPGRIADIHERLRQKNAASAPARAARILAGLGFDHAAQQRPLDEFSGGWRMRVMLASLLFTQPDLLLLDEPTNHLDLEATLWLEDYLRQYDGTVVIVSHDRDILNRVAQEILHLEHGKLTLYQGGYDRFEATRRARLEQDEKLRVRQEAQRAHIQQFVDRFRYKASKARQAQSRIKMLERMEPIGEHRDEAGVTFAFPDPDVMAPPLFGAQDVSVGYDGKAVLSHLSFRLDEDDRIALLGANGNGKSTLIRLLGGRLTPMAGVVSAAPKLRVGYFAQHQAEELDLDATPIVELSRRRPQDTPVQIRSQLARFGFTQERAHTTVMNLSGGEKARLLFALMTSDRPHVLLLDEPTNHLDIDSRQALVQAINAFSGAVVIVSHDPHVVELTADRLWLVADGTVSPFDGDMAEYRAMMLSGGEVKSRQDGRPGDAASRRDQRREAAARRKLLAPMRKEMQAAERTVESLSARKSGLEAAMADPALYAADNAKLVALQKELGDIGRELSDAETLWLELQEKLEMAEADGD
ncbi:MAG: ABC-F family ATP-binding cassette domain-containing protein [Rhodospirillaceae bacterium]